MAHPLPLLEHNRLHGQTLLGQSALRRILAARSPGYAVIILKVVGKLVVVLDGDLFGEK